MSVTTDPYWGRLVFDIVVFSNPRIDDGILSDMPYISKPYIQLPLPCIK